jgi:hypothetical protein
MLWRYRLVILNVNKNMMSFRGQASLAKMSSPGGKLTAQGCHLIIKVNKAEELTFLNTYRVCSTKAHA